MSLSSLGNLPEPDWQAAGAEDGLRTALRGAQDARARSAAYSRLAEALRTTRQWEAAAWGYFAAHRERPDAAEYVNLGIVLHESGRHDIASEALHLALRFRDHPMSDTTAAYRNIALLPGANALEMLGHAAALSPASVEVQHALGNELRRRGAADDALRAFSRAASLRPHGAAELLTVGEVRVLMHICK